MQFMYAITTVWRRIVPLLAAAVFAVACADADEPLPNSYDALAQLFADWREFERPPLREGAPDYTAERFANAYEEFATYRERLNAIDISDWPVAQQVDWHMVRAEMNGFDFNHRVLKPWVRDPAYYQSVWTYKSDVPAHEGPTHHATLELWTYSFPLSSAEQQRLIRDLEVIPPLMSQAQRNLTGNARDLWVAGIRNIQAQRRHLDSIMKTVGSKASDELGEVIRAAQSATDELVAWLEADAPSKTGPSGIGKDDYTWYQQNVHYVPLSWEQEVDLLQRELDRAWSSLKLEEHRNRDLPPQVAASTAEEFARLNEGSVRKLMTFLEEQEVMPIKDNMEPALREQIMDFVPEEDRNFFEIGAHYDPTPLFTHFYHWFELAQMRDEPHASPVRRGPVLYNIYDSRNEGTATGVEEMFMHAGLYDDNPRSREIVWIMLAQRAARGLGSLYAHANDMTMAEAGTVHVEWTPRGWMGNEPELMQFEQQLYLRQPGYGTSYVTGKYLLERLLAQRTKQMEARNAEYTLRDFYGELNDAGSVPIALVTWQLTGNDDDIRKIMAGS